MLVDEEEILIVWPYVSGVGAGANLSHGVQTTIRQIR